MGTGRLRQRGDQGIQRRRGAQADSGARRQRPGRSRRHEQADTAPPSIARGHAGCQHHGAQCRSGSGGSHDLARRIRRDRPADNHPAAELPSAGPRPSGYLTSTWAPASSSLVLRLLGVFLGRLLEDRLRRAVDQVLGLLEAQAGELADVLDHLDLLVAGGVQDDVELVLLLGGLGGTAAPRARRRRRPRPARRR